MKIGMLTGIWHVAESVTLQASLERAAALGFRYVDLHGVFHAGPAHLSREQRRALPAELAALGLTPRNYVLHPPVNIVAATEVEVERSYLYLTEGIDLAVAWGINQIMFNAGQWVYGIDRVQAWAKSVRFWQRVCDYAAPRGVFVAQETEPYVWFLVNDTASTLRMREDVGRPNFVTLVDLGHMGLAREGPEYLAQLGDSIIHAHFSDHEQFRHTNQVVGTGVTRTVEYLDMLCRLDVDRMVKRFGYDELVISFELGAPGDRIADADDWVRRSIEHVRQAAPYLTLA
jgi:sugar phosphate isomerase/epimerase